MNLRDLKATPQPQDNSYRLLSSLGQLAVPPPATKQLITSQNGGEPVDYDYNGYIAKHGMPDQSKGQHLTDEFKLPNHITFSKESKYSTPEMMGGEWREVGGKWEYEPSEYVISQHGADRLRDYFRRNEPDARLVLPVK